MHPFNRAERRYQRDRVVAHRKALRTVEKWYFSDLQRWGEPVWGRYAKWNGNCGQTMCHGAKYFKCKAKRRKALKFSLSQAEFRRKDKAAGKL